MVVKVMTSWRLTSWLKGLTLSSKSIKGGPRTFCFIPLCCLLRLTALRRGGGSSEIGPTCRMGAFNSCYKDAGWLVDQWEKRSLHKVLFEALIGNKCAETSVWVSMRKEDCLKGKWINVPPCLFCLFSVWMNVGAVMSGLCPEWDLHSRSPSVSTLKHRGTSCTMLEEVPQR